MNNAKLKTEKFLKGKTTKNGENLEKMLKCVKALHKELPITATWQVKITSKQKSFPNAFLMHF